MATQSKSVVVTAQSLKAQADAIRLARQGGVQAPKDGVGFFAGLGFASADLVNGFATVGDAYTIRRAERS
jgi:hypothetical protein